MNWRFVPTATLVTVMLTSFSAEAALHSRLGGQAYYDDQLDITWAANANINGTDTWGNQVTWVENLSIDGVTGWRLPNMDINNDSTVAVCSFLVPQASCQDNEYGHLYRYGAGTAWGNGVRSGVPGPFSNIQAFSYWSNTVVAPVDAWSFAMSNGSQTHFFKEGFLYAWAVHDGDVNPVSLVDVTYDTPTINFGPISFGLTVLPAEPNVTFSLNDGTPAGGGVTSYGLGNVLSTNLVFGDVIGPNNFTTFAMEVDAGGVTTALSYAFVLPDSDTVEGPVILNFPFTVTGTDIASGDPFSYTYANSEVTITPVPGPGDFNGDLLVDGADFLKWQRGETPEMGSAAELALWESQFGATVPPLSALKVATPEPSSLLLASLTGAIFGCRRRRI